MEVVLFDPVFAAEQLDRTPDTKNLDLLDFAIEYLQTEIVLLKHRQGLFWYALGAGLHIRQLR